MRKTLWIVMLMLASVAVTVPAHAEMRGMQSPGLVQTWRGFWDACRWFLTGDDGTPSRWHNAVTIARLTGR